MGMTRICKRGHEAAVGRACKQCTLVNQAAYRDTNRARIRDNLKRSRRKDPARNLLWSVQARAKREGIPCDLTTADLLVSSTCPVLGIELRFAAEGRDDHTPSVDRIDPTRGYVRGNVAVISWRANRMKGRFGIDEFRQLIAWWEKAA